VKIGRTHLQDATPLTLGQEFPVTWRSSATRGMRFARCAGLCELAIGGTAVGTGLNTHRSSPTRFARSLPPRRKSLCSAPNKFAALAGHEALAFAMAR